MDIETTDLPAQSRLHIEHSTTAPQTGVIRFLDAQGIQVGQIPFAELDEASPCFTSGTMIATARGEVTIEKLKVGDKVITRDNGLQVIRWIGSRKVNAAMTLTHAHLAPVSIRKGALGNDLPERDMMVSPNHKMLVTSDQAVLHFDDNEVLVAAKHLTGLAGVRVAQNVRCTYLHLMFDQHELVLANGAWSESFHPNVRTIAGMGNAQRLELLELFPKLATPEGLMGFKVVRPTNASILDFLTVK